MEVSVKTKFSVGDIVKIKQRGIIFDEAIRCPICQGNYTKPNPNYGKNGIKESELKCSVCHEGKFLVGFREGDIILENYYEVVSISVTLNKKDIKVNYYLKNSFKNIENSSEEKLFDKGIILLGGQNGSTIIVSEDRIVGKEDK